LDVTWCYGILVPVGSHFPMIKSGVHVSVHIMVWDQHHINIMDFNISVWKQYYIIIPKTAVHILKHEMANDVACNTIFVKYIKYLSL